MSGLVVPDRIGEPIRAFRMWRLSANRKSPRRYQAAVPNKRFGSLLPMNEIDEVWPGGAQLVARCWAVDEDGEYRRHEAPDPRCRCGAYGLKELDWVEEPLLHVLAGALKKYADWFTPRRSRHLEERWFVVGSVLLWGTVVEGRYGYRAQHAYPEQLWLLPPARLGGDHGEHGCVESSIALARDLLVVLRRRYRCPVGYAGNDREVTRLIQRGEVGWFFSWRLSSTGHDCFDDALGDHGQSVTALPTVTDALQLWLEQSNGNRASAERVVRHLAPAFGTIPIDRRGDIARVTYAPVNAATRRPLVPRTIRHHYNVLNDALALADLRWPTSS